MIPIRDNVPAQRWPWVTISIIVLTLVVFIVELLLSAEQLHDLISTWGVVPTQVLTTRFTPELQTPPHSLLSLFTYMFLHGSWLHIISNMWILWLFGDNVEDRLGHGRYIAFYLCCGVVAMLAHVLLSSGSSIPVIGASGAVAGIMGAYFRFFPLARVVVLIPIVVYPVLIEVPAALFLLLWLLIQFFSGASSLLAGTQDYIGVAFWAHVGGFVAGMIFSYLWRGSTASATA